MPCDVHFSYSFQSWCCGFYVSRQRLCGESLPVTRTSVGIFAESFCAESVALDPSRQSSIEVNMTSALRAGIRTNCGDCRFACLLHSALRFDSGLLPFFALLGCHLVSPFDVSIISQSFAMSSIISQLFSMEHFQCNIALNGTVLDFAQIASGDEAMFTAKSDADPERV